MPFFKIVFSGIRILTAIKGTINAAKATPTEARKPTWIYVGLKRLQHL